MLTMAAKKQAIDEIADANDGIATPDIVVQTARNPRHPLHQCFNWNDKTAAHQHRLDIARHLIASVEVIIEYEDVITTAISYIHDVRQGRRGQGYVSIDALGKRRQDAEASLLIELERVVAVVERARGIAGSLGLTSFFEAILDNALQAKLRIQRKGKKAA